MKRVIFIVLVMFIVCATLVVAGEKEKNAVEVKEVDTTYVAAMEFQGSYKKMEAGVQTFMGEFFKQGLQPGGPMMSVYFNSDTEVKEEELKWAMGFKVNKGTTVKEPLKIVELKKTKALVYLHVGPYEKLEEAYSKVFAFLKEKGYKMTWPVYDKYLNNPMTAKPEDLKTEITVPIKEKK